MEWFFKRHRRGRSSTWIVRLYLVAVVGVGAALRFSPPLLGITVTVGVLGVLLNEALARGRLGEELDAGAVRQNAISDAAAALTLVPIMTLLARSAPVPGPGVVPILIVSSATLAATLLLVRPVSPLTIGSVLAADRTQLAIGAIGVPLGLAALFAVELPAVDPRPGPALAVLWSAVFIVFVGFVGELVFRVVIQTALARALGSQGILAAAVASAAFGASLGSLRYAAVLGLSGALFGWCFHRTDSVLGTSMASGILHIGIFLLWSPS